MKKKKRRRWYSISVDTLRLASVPVLALLILSIAVISFRTWKAAQMEQEAHEVIEEADTLAQNLKPTLEVRDAFRRQFAEALTSLQEAHEEMARRDFAQAISHGLQSHRLLLAIQQARRDRDFSGVARFVSVQGDVQYRRGERGRWQAARNQVVLHTGDSVRTERGGSAEIVFDDGTLFGIRPDSQMLIPERRTGSGASNGSEDGGEQSVKMEYGRLNLSTAKRPGKVETPSAEARVERDSEAYVGFEKETRKGLYGVYRGQMGVRTQEGESRTLAALQEVEQNGDEISAPRPLPLAPELRQPPDNSEINLDEVERLVLSWTPVEGGEHYALQISESHLFVDNLIDASNRATTEATLGIQGEGSFLWRVAALNDNGAQGPWSAPRRFRVASLAGRTPGEDRVAPSVELTSVTPYGNIYIVEGKTESGATVNINEEPVKVEADGTFKKLVQFVKEGWNNIEVRASDAWGNESTLTHQVFVETP